MIDPTLMVSVIRIYLADRNIGFAIWSCADKTGDVYSSGTPALRRPAK
jgi:hypothetical protein